MELGELAEDAHDADVAVVVAAEVHDVGGVDARDMCRSVAQRDNGVLSPHTEAWT